MEPLDSPSRRMQHSNGSSDVQWCSQSIGRCHKAMYSVRLDAPTRPYCQTRVIKAGTSASCDFTCTVVANDCGRVAEFDDIRSVCTNELYTIRRGNSRSTEDSEPRECGRMIHRLNPHYEEIIILDRARGLRTEVHRSNNMAYFSPKKSSPSSS